MTEPHDHPPIPERIGRYEVLLPIASGGMGTVYLARNVAVGGFEREVAVKVMHSHLRAADGFTDDLLEEAKLAARIRHPNVVPVLDAGVDPHGVFLVMEYVEGDSFARLLRSEKQESLDPSIGLRIVVDALRGLHAAHELRDADGELLGVVHRDVSPHNILVGVDGLSRLADFGVAKARTRLSHTATGLVKGKITYMSPEQAKGEPLDRRCDIWAAGVMLWELLAKRRLYLDRNDTAILLQLISQPPPRLRTVDSSISRELDDAVARALTTSSKLRCPDADTLADDLTSAAETIGGLASAQSVGALVREHASGRLSKRAQQIEQMMALRQQMGHIASEATTTQVGTTPPQRMVGGLHTKVSAEAEAMIDATSGATTDDTTTTSVSEPDRRTRARTDRLSRALTVAALGVATVAVAWGLTRGSAPAPATMPSTLRDPRVQTTTPAPTLSVAARPQPTTSASAATATAATTALPSAKPIERPTTQAKVVPSGKPAVTAKRSRSKKKPAPLAPSPYE